MTSHSRVATRRFGPFQIGLFVCAAIFFAGALIGISAGLAGWQTEWFLNVFGGALLGLCAAACGWMTAESRSKSSEASLPARELPGGLVVRGQLGPLFWISVVIGVFLVVAVVRMAFLVLASAVPPIDGAALPTVLNMFAFALMGAVFTVSFGVEAHRVSRMPLMSIGATGVAVAAAAGEVGFLPWSEVPWVRLHVDRARQFTHHYTWNFGGVEIRYPSTVRPKPQEIAQAIRQVAPDITMSSGA